MQSKKQKVTAAVDYCIGCGLVPEEERTTLEDNLFDAAEKASVALPCSFEGFVDAFVELATQASRTKFIKKKEEDLQEIMEGLDRALENGYLYVHQPKDAQPPLPVYREKQHPRRTPPKRPYWLRTRSNPQRRRR